MVYNFTFPDVGEGIQEGEIVKWHVKVGDTIKEDQVIAEVETDKAVVEIPSPASGKILSLHGKVGSTIKVGEVIAEIDDGKGGKQTAKKSVPPKKESGFGPKTKGKEPTAPTVAEHIDYSQQTQERVEQVHQEQPPEEVKSPPQNHAEKKIVAHTAVAGRVLATPSTRKLARELRVDLSQLKGTGDHGRITAEDVRHASEGKVTVKAVTEQGKAVVTKKQAPLPDFSHYGKVLTEPYKSIRKTIGDNLSRSFHTAVHVTHHDKADVTALVNFRNKEKHVAEKKGFKLTYLAFIIKAVCSVLKHHPYLNSSLDEEKGIIVLKQFYNIGIAVQTEKGLLVPVIAEADRKSILDIAKEIYSLAQHARDSKLSLEDMKGGTFTITNVGSIGGEYFTPIINYPECAILGVGSVKDEVVVVDGKAVIKKLLPLSLSFDHRIVDGAKAAVFVNELKSLLEDPELFMLNSA